MRKRTRRTVAAGFATLVLAAAGCGDDGDGAASGTTAAGGGAATTNPADSEYCAVSREVDAQEDFPDAEQLQRLQELAPEEIAEEAAIIVPIFTEAIEAGDPFAAFEDPQVQENLPAIEAYDEEVCGIGGDDGEGEGAAPVEIAPEDEEFCALATEINEQEQFPTSEQLESYRDLAPEEIRDEATTVVDAFLAAGDDPFAAFEAPGVDEAFAVIEPFEAERCGIGGDDSGEEDEESQDPSVTQPDESAAQVAVSAVEYDFVLEPTLAAGRTQFTMTNDGQERHVMLLFRLAEGATLDDALESEGEEGIDGPELESDSVTSGETAVLTTDLEPGTYGLICYIPTADGTPHLVLGMAEELTVQ